MLKKRSIPLPTLENAARSQHLMEILIHQIRAQDGAIPFKDYMELALYHPEYGYYTSHPNLFRTDKDFNTAPEISPLFSKAIARFCQTHLKAPYQIAEFGAGSGKMAAMILQTLNPSHASEKGDAENVPPFLQFDQRNDREIQYFIIEKSPLLRRQQQQLFQQYYPKLSAYVSWLNELPQNFSGIILANEVLDALPIHLFHWNGKDFLERYVTETAGKLIFCERPLQHPEKFFAPTDLQKFTANWPTKYYSESHHTQDEFINYIASRINSGLVLFLDYGYNELEYYHPQRDHGTLTCIYQKIRHDDPLIYPGLQDITAHVNFSRLANQAKQAGLQLAGYTQQAAFLLNCGILTDLNQLPSEMQWQATQAVKLLLSPDEMGELIKVICFTKDDVKLELGFQEFDKGYCL